MSVIFTWRRSMMSASVLLALSVAQVASQSASAATLNWVGSSSSDIADPLNYGGTSPVGQDLVFGLVGVGDNAPATLGSSLAVNGLQFVDGMSPTIVAVTPADVLTIQGGGMSFDASSLTSTLNIPMVLGATQSWINAGANQTINGAITAGSNDLTVTGPFTMNGSNTFHGATLGAVTMNGSNTFNGAVTFAGSTVNNGINVFNGTVQVTNGYFHSGHNTFKQTVTISNAAFDGTVINSFAGTLQVNGVLNATNGGLGNSEVAGVLSFGAGSTMGAQSDVVINKPVNLAGTLDLYNNNHTVNIAGAITQANGATNLWMHQNGSVILSGTKTNTNLGVVLFDQQTLVLAKESSAAVHALDRAASITIGATLKLAGTGGDQIKDTMALQLDGGVVGGALDMNGRNEGFDMLNGGGTVTNHATGTTSTLTLGTNNSAPLPYFTGTIQDAEGKVGLAKVGTGNMAITKSTTFTGTGGLTVTGGTLTIDYASYQDASIQAGTPTVLTDFVDAGNTVTLGGGKLQVNGHGSAEAGVLYGDFVPGAKVSILSGTAGLTVGQTVTGAGIDPDTYIIGVPDPTNIYLNHQPMTADTGVELTFGAVNVSTVQNFAGVILAPGGSSLGVAVPSGINNGVVANLGMINRQVGGTVDFTLPSGDQTATNGILTQSANSAGTILGGWATVNGTDWAVSAGDGTNAGNITAFNGYSWDYYDVGVDTNVTMSNNLDSMTTNSVRFSNGSTLTLTGTNTISSGGILIPKSVGGNQVTITGGALVSGNGTGLIVTTAGANNQAVIASEIVDDGATKLGLTKSGPGTLTISAANTYTGPTHVSGGALVVASTSNMGVGSAVVLSGGSSLTFTTGAAGGQLNLQDPNVVATASSDAQPASRAVDGNSGTRWETVAGETADPSWIVIDLGGQVLDLSQVNIWWEAANARDMQLQVANDGTDIGTYPPNEAGAGGVATNGWTTALNVVNQHPITNNYTSYFLPDGTSGRYLAMYGTARNLTYGYSIWEMQIFQKVNTANIVQSVGSLASSDATTSVVLPARLELSVGSDNTSTTFAGTISGAGMIQKVGNGNLTLSGTNSYNGGTVVESGTVTFATAAARPANDVLTINKNAGSHQGAMVVIGGAGESINTYRAQLLSGLNPNASGPVIRTTAGVASEGIGYLLGSDYNAIHGTTLDSSSVVFKYTFLGDVNLDGMITGVDFAQIDASYLLGTYASAGSNATWINGDFNYDGKVNVQDFAIIDAAFTAYTNGGRAALAREAADAGRFGAEFTAAYNAALGNVPEPASLGLLALGAVGLLGRRRR